MPAILEHKTEETAEKSEERKASVRLRGRLPEKRTINLAIVNVRRIDWRIAAPLMVLVLLVVAVFGKFAVVDRIGAAAAARGEVAALQAKLDQGYRTIEDFGEINDLYAHYTYSGMSQEELSRVDRVEMMSMIERVVLPIAPVDNWSVSENRLVLDIKGKTLLEINHIVQLLLAEDMVDYCTVTTAASAPSARGDERALGDTVTANVVVQLRSVGEEAAS